jgi:hypothetical protein
MRSSKNTEVECKFCGADCYWEDGVLMELDTDEAHRCIHNDDDDVDMDFEVL